MARVSSDERKLSGGGTPSPAGTHLSGSRVGGGRAGGVVCAMVEGTC